MQNSILQPNEYGNPSATQQSVAGFVNETAVLSKIPVCRRTLKNWRDTGKLPFCKIGKRILYHLPSVETALLRMQKGGTE